MPLGQEEIISVCKQLAEEEGLRVCVTQSLQGACIAGLGALAGGLLLGPPGLAIGGIIGSITAATKGSGKFKSVGEVIMYDMTPTQRAKLAQSVSRAVMNVRPEEIAIFAVTVLTTDSLKQVVIRELTGFIQKELNLSIV